MRITKEDITMWVVGLVIVGFLTVVVLSVEPDLCDRIRTHPVRCS